MLPHRDKWDVHHAQIDELVYIGRDVFVMVRTSLEACCLFCSRYLGCIDTRTLQRY